MSYVEISPSFRNVTLQLDVSMKYPTSARMSIFSAVHMRAMGLFPFPLANPRIQGRESFKRPGMRAWQYHAEYSRAEQLDSWDREGGNLGLYLQPSGLVALDSDTEEAESWAAKNLPETPWITKTAKGRHRLYRLGRFAQTPIDNKPIPGMDRKHSGYIVAPGSWHFVENCEYQSEGDWSVPLRNLPIYSPTWFPERPKVRGTSGKKLRIPLGNSMEVVDRARQWLAHRDRAISGKGGHLATYKAALGLVRGFGLDEETALELLLKDYNPRCSPPWSLKELRHKVAQVAFAKLEFDSDGWLLNEGKAK